MKDVYQTGAQSGPYCIPVEYDPPDSIEDADRPAVSVADAFPINAQFLIKETTMKAPLVCTSCNTDAPNIEHCLRCFTKAWMKEGHHQTQKQDIADAVQLWRTVLMPDTLLPTIMGAHGSSQAQEGHIKILRGLFSHIFDLTVKQRDKLAAIGVVRMTYIDVSTICSNGGG